jgi:hypothetical protein
MSDKAPLSKRWEDFRPSKALWFWSCAACVVLTMVLGFSAGGWMLGGTAQAMADDASKQARADLASTVCVSKFMKSPDAAATLATLKETQSWKRDDIIKEGGWATMIGIDKPSSDTIDMCADKLAEMEMPATAETGTTEAGTAGG